MPLLCRSSASDELFLPVLRAADQPTSSTERSRIILPRSVLDIAFLCWSATQRQLHSAGTESCSSIADSNTADVVRSFSVLVMYLRTNSLCTRALLSGQFVL